MWFITIILQNRFRFSHTAKETIEPKRALLTSVAFVVHYNHSTKLSSVHLHRKRNNRTQKDFVNFCCFVVHSKSSDIWALKLRHIIHLSYVRFHKQILNRYTPYLVLNYSTLSTSKLHIAFPPFFDDSETGATFQSPESLITHLQNSLKIKTKYL